MQGAIAASAPIGAFVSEYNRPSYDPSSFWAVCSCLAGSEVPLLLSMISMSLKHAWRTKPSFIPMPACRGQLACTLIAMVSSTIKQWISTGGMCTAGGDARRFARGRSLAALPRQCQANI